MSVSHNVRTINRMTNKKQQRCKLCDKRFISIGLLKKHAFKYHYEDDVKDETIKYKLSPVKKKMKSVSICSSCGFDYLIPSELKRHESLRHPKDDTVSGSRKVFSELMCKICCMEFSSEPDMMSHKKFHDI